MAVSSASLNQKLAEEFGELGRVGLNAKYPTEFEVYLMSLELIDSLGKTVDFFSFPIMPNQITKNESKKVNIKKSSSGVTVITSDANVPAEITIKGDFGKSFKIAIKPQLGEVEGFGFKGFFNNLSVNTPTFDVGVKTGFGCIKILQSIVDKSLKLDSKGKPHRLFLYNMALSESYLVSITPQGITLNQTYDRNMIWNYSIVFNVLAPLDKIKAIYKEDSTQKLLDSSVVQNFSNRLASEIKNIL